MTLCPSARRAHLVMSLGAAQGSERQHMHATVLGLNSALATIPCGCMRGQGREESRAARSISRKGTCGGLHHKSIPRGQLTLYVDGFVFSLMDLRISPGGTGAGLLAPAARPRFGRPLGEEPLAPADAAFRASSWEQASRRQTRRSAFHANLGSKRRAQSRTS
jgi:hypothetical protein